MKLDRVSDQVLKHMSQLRAVHHHGREGVVGDCCITIVNRYFQVEIVCSRRVSQSGDGSTDLSSYKESKKEKKRFPKYFGQSILYLCRMIVSEYPGWQCRSQSSSCS